MGKRKRKSKSKSPIVAILIGGGVLAYFLLKKDSSTTSTTATDTGNGGSPVTIPGDGLQDSVLDQTITVTPPAVVPAAPKYIDIFTAVPGLANMTRDALVLYLTPIIKTVYGYKNVDLSSYSLPKLQFMYGIGQYIPVSNTQYWKAFNSMTERELGDSWTYITSYLTKSKALVFSDDPGLYNEIATIHAKYNIF